MMNDPYAGVCPFDSGELVHDGYYVKCLNGDYKANAAKWLEIWNDFRLSSRGLEESEKLLADLQALNETT